MKRILLLILTLSLALSMMSLTAFAEVDQSKNEPLIFFDFTAEESIHRRDNEGNYYWANEGMTLMPTGNNEDKIEFVKSEDGYLQLNFNGDMTTNLSCLWFSLGASVQLSNEESYYLAIRYKYIGDATAGFLSEQVLTGYNAVTLWSAGNSGGRHMKPLSSGGMVTMQDGEWRVAYLRISWNEVYHDLGYTADRIDIGVIRTSLMNEISNKSVVMQSFAIFSDVDQVLSNASKIDENMCRELRSTQPVSFSMKSEFDKASDIKYYVDTDKVEHTEFYKKSGSEYTAIEGVPTEDGEYKLELSLKDTYWFDMTLKNVSGHTLTKEFKIGKTATPVPPASTPTTDTKTTDPQTTNKAPVTDNDSDKAPDGEKSDSNTALYVIIAVVAVVAIAVVLILVLKKKK